MDSLLIILVGILIGISLAILYFQLKSRSKQNENKKTQVNKKELELLKKQVEELKKAEKKKQQEIERLKKS